MVGLDREHEGHHFVRQFIKNQAESNEFMVMKPTMLHGIANVFDHNGYMHMLSSENRELHYFSIILHFKARFFLYNLFKVLIVQDDAEIHSLIAHCFTFNDRFGIDARLLWTFCP